MPRTAIFEALFQALVDDPDLVPGILGPRTVTNQRLYRSFPQIQSLLTSFEPGNGGEGWLVLEEQEPGLRAAIEQFDTVHEVLEVVFHIYGNRYAIGDAVTDILDTFWHWSVDQQREIQYGDRILLFTRRLESSDTYAKDIKLFEKVLKYRMVFVPETVLA